MGNGRKLKRQLTSKLRKENPIQKLSFLLGDFYEMLVQKDKPDDESVREAFLQSDKEWVEYCELRGLGESYKKMFNLNVSKMWEKKSQKSQ